jgi:guanosine-3',5'-bis(diphosphate) 3'-pyrophosphohydrolase
MKTFDDLKALIAISEHDYDLDVIERAYRLAEESHRDQKRLSGAPYISHPVAVACILVELGMDTDSVAAGLLHDVVEDTPISLDQIRKQFGAEIASLTDGVTKLGRIPYSSREVQQAENLRKMLMAMNEDIRVIIIKLADRLHNMRTSEYWDPQKQRDKARENMEVYAPIAHRLGIRAVKEELEDLSLRILDPVAYREIEDGLELRASERNRFIEMTKKRIRERVSVTIPNVYLEGRVKSINGIYRKMFVQGRTMDEIYDIYAVRVIVDTVNDCYNVLGIIHDMFRPLPNRFKDYISTPKPNMYQSLHTTVIGKEGIPFEVQIRTWEMHHTAEYGIAAHWKYKLGMKGGQEDSFEKRLSWIRQMLDNEKDSEDATDLVRMIKSDLVPEEVFVFTPRGDVISLPSGSTVIDFAYAIHSAVGNRMIGAKVDKRIAPLDYRVKTGEIVEILTSKEARGPSRDWLKIVHTSEARNKIRTWFKREKRDENIAEGRAEMDRELRRNGITASEEELAAILQKLAPRNNCATVEDVYAAIGYGGISMWKILPKIKDAWQKEHAAAPVIPAQEKKPQVQHKNAAGVVVDGMDNCLIKFARCCNPLPGDDIIGFITRGFGVSIHKRSCSNVPQIISESAEPERWVKVHWAGGFSEEFKTTLEIVAEDRSGLLADITQQLFSMHLFIHSLNSRETKDGSAFISATISVTNLDQLKSIMSRLSNISGVLSIRRT